MPTPDMQPIVAGLSLDLASGQASIAPELTETLLDLAEALGDLTGLPVDLEHVVAAIVLAARDGHLHPDTQLSPDNLTQRAALIAPIRRIFRDYDGDLDPAD